MALVDGLRPLVACVTDRPLFASRVVSQGNRFGVAFRPFDRPAPVSLRSGDRLPFFVDLTVDVGVESPRDHSVRIMAYR